MQSARTWKEAGPNAASSRHNHALKRYIRSTLTRYNSVTFIPMEFLKCSLGEFHHIPQDSTLYQSAQSVPFLNLNFHKHVHNRDRVLDIGLFISHPDLTAQKRAYCLLQRAAPKTRVQTTADWLLSNVSRHFFRLFCLPFSLDASHIYIFSPQS